MVRFLSFHLKRRKFILKTEKTLQPLEFYWYAHLKAGNQNQCMLLNLFYAFNKTAIIIQVRLKTKNYIHPWQTNSGTNVGINTNIPRACWCNSSQGVNNGLSTAVNPFLDDSDTLPVYLPVVTARHLPTFIFILLKHPHKNGLQKYFLNLEFILLLVIR